MNYIKIVIYLLNIYKIVLYLLNYRICFNHNYNTMIKYIMQFQKIQTNNQ